MTKTIKETLNIIAFVISLSDAITFYVQKEFAVFWVIVFISLGLLSAAIYLHRLKPISYLSLSWIITILDNEAASVNINKLSKIKANIKNITTIFDRNFESDGNLEFLGTNIGKLQKPYQEGASITVPTSLKTPLEVGKVIEHKLQLEVKNPFPQKTETFSIKNDECYSESICCEIIFPKDRKCINASAYCVLGDEGYSLPNPELKEDGRVLFISVPKPRKLFKYVVEWQW